MFWFNSYGAYVCIGVFNIAFYHAYKVQPVVNKIALAEWVLIYPFFNLRFNPAHYRYCSVCIHSVCVVYAGGAYIIVLVASLP